MTANTQILQAAILGTKAYKEGKQCVPAHDASLLEMFRGRQIGETPEGEACTIALLRVWQQAWHDANLAEAVNA